jgi:ketosteroid isomerase-like protein
MQSPQDLAQIADVDRELVDMRVHAYFELLAEGKTLDGLMEFFSSDVDFELIGNWSIFPQSGRLRGKDALAHALITIYTSVENLGSTLRDLVIDGDRIALMRSTRLRSYGTGRVGDIMIADFLRIRDGLVVEFTEVVDSLAIARLEAC